MLIFLRLKPWIFSEYSEELYFFLNAQSYLYKFYVSLIILLIFLEIFQAHFFFFLTFRAKISKIDLLSILIVCLIILCKYNCDILFFQHTIVGIKN